MLGFSAFLVFLCEDIEKMYVDFSDSEEKFDFINLNFVKATKCLSNHASSTALVEEKPMNYFPADQVKIEDFCGEMHTEEYSGMIHAYLLGIANMISNTSGTECHPEDMEPYLTQIDPRLSVDDAKKILKRLTDHQYYSVPEQSIFD